MAAKRRRPQAKAAGARKRRASRSPAARRAAPARNGAAPPDALDDFIDAAGRALALPVDPAWREAIKLNLAVILRHASAFADFPLPDEAEPAPVFVA